MPEEERVHDIYKEPEDTEETGFWGRMPILGWLRRTSRAFGKARGLLLVLGWMCLVPLGLYLGWPKLEQISDWMVGGIHRLLVWMSAAGGETPGLHGLGGLSPATRYRLTGLVALAWGGWIFIRLVWLCWPQRQGEEEMGYIVPGSGWLARSWAVVGRQIYRLRRAFSLSFAYVRDLNIEKLYLPLAVLAFSILGGVSTSFALENILFELHVALPGIFSATGWMRPVSLALGFLCAVMVGLPMLAESFRQTHTRALKRRKGGQRLVFRLLSGLGGTVTILAPAAWMLLGLLAGDLWP